MCSQHIVNIMRVRLHQHWDLSQHQTLQVTVCLCPRDTCNGPSLPPREMIEEDHELIDIDEVVKSLQEAQEQVVQPEPVSSRARTISVSVISVISVLLSAL